MYGRMLILTHDRSMTDRRAAWKQRDAQGLVVLSVVANETDVAELLIAWVFCRPRHCTTPRRRRSDSPSRNSSQA